jgi:hypothetical protein
LSGGAENATLVRRKLMDRNVPNVLRTSLLVVSLLLLLVGVGLFIFAESVATLPANVRGGNTWPWPIGPLAIRFVASLVLATAVAAFLVFRRSDYPTVTVFAIVLIIGSGMFLLHAAVNIRNIDWSRPLATVYVSLLTVGFIVGVVLLVLGRRNAVAAQMLPRTPTSARTIALFIAGLTGLVGATMFFFPDFSRDRWPWDLVSPVNVQWLGALFLIVAIVSLISWLQPSWYGYDTFYAAAGTFSGVALIASFMHWNLFAARPITSWLFVIIYIAGTVMGFFPFFRYALAYGRKSTSQSA